MNRLTPFIIVFSCLTIIASGIATSDFSPLLDKICSCIAAISTAISTYLASRSVSPVELLKAQSKLTIK